MIPTLRSAAAVGKLSHRASSALSSTSSPSSVTGGFHHQPKSYHHPHFQDSRWTVFLLQARWQSSSTSSQALHAPFGPISRSSAASSVGSGVRKAESTLATSFGSSSSSTKSLRLPSNMVFRSAAAYHRGHSTLATTVQFDLESPSSSASSETFEITKDGMTATTTATRPLVLLFAWMLSKNIHIEKYRQFWISRGYDILTVQTSPSALLMPSIGGAKIAETVFRYLATATPRYDQVIVHAFSVGGYQLCELLYRLSNGVAAGDPQAKAVFSSLKALIIDSCVFAEDAAPGLSRAITHHPLWQPLLEASMGTFFKLTKPYTIERYLEVSSHLFANEMRIPGLLLISEDDVVSSVQTNCKLAEGWRKAQGKAVVKCWERSSHVLHYREHPEEYEYEVDRFVAELEAVTKAPKRKPVPPPPSAA